MKLLFLTDSFPPYSFGGAGIVTHNLVKELQKKGYKFYIITTTQDKSLEGVSNFEDLRVHRIYSNYHSRWQAYLGLHNPRAISKIKKIIKEIGPDIVHVHNIHKYLSYRCLKIAKKYSKAVFLTVHDVMLVHYEKFLPRGEKDICKISIWEQIKTARKRYNPFRNIIIRHYLRYVDKIFTVSSSLKKLLEINGIKNTETIYNGINLNDWEVDLGKVREFKEKYNLHNKKAIFFCGRLSGAKGGDQILKAAALIKNELKNIVLLVAGQKNQYVEKMKGLVKELDIEKNVIFTGQLKGDELKVAYHSAAISVSPSICFETFGMTNLEAMACRKPVVSGHFGGPREVVVNNKTGYLINPHNIELMTEKILDLLNNPKKAKRFGEAGYRRAREFFSLNKQVEETLKYYLEALKSPLQRH